MTIRDQLFELNKQIVQEHGARLSFFGHGAGSMLVAPVIAHQDHPPRWGTPCSLSDDAAILASARALLHAYEKAL